MELGKNTFIYIYIGLLIIIASIGFIEVGNKMKYNAFKETCEDLDVGIEYDEYVCYNASQQATTHNWGLDYGT